MEQNTASVSDRKGFLAQMPVTLLLIVACCAMYIAMPGDITYACSYDNVFVYHRWWTTVTALFLHGSLLHLLGNMLFLFLFGKALEARTGSLLLLVIFIVGGAASMLLSVLYYPHHQPSVGASGAISCILATLMLFNPWRFSLLLNLMPMPIGVAGFTFLLLNINGFIRDHNGVPDGTSHTSYLGHLAGFAAGIFFGMLLSKEWKKNLLLSILQFVIYYTILWLIVRFI